MARALTDNDLMPFGKHKNERMEDVPATYLDWLRDQDWLKASWPEVWQYIQDNEAVIDSELRDAGID